MSPENVNLIFGIVMGFLIGFFTHALFHFIIEMRKLSKGIKESELKIQEIRRIMINKSLEALGYRGD